MSTASLEQRVAALEMRYAELLQLVQVGPARNAWRSVVGLFADVSQIAELHRETERIRAADRDAARDPSSGET